MDNQLHKRIIATGYFGALIGVAWVIHHTAFPLPVSSPDNLGVLFILLNLMIVVVWFSVGPVVGVTGCIITLFLATFSSIKFSSVFYLAHGCAAGACTLCAHIFYKRLGDVLLRYEVGIERLTENANLIIADRQRKKKQVMALEKRYERMWLLRTLTETMGQILSLDDMAQYIAREAFRLVGKSDTSLLFMVDEHRQELALKVSWGYAGHPNVKLKKGDIFDHWVLKQRQPLIVNDITQDFRFDVDMDDEQLRPFRSLIAVPLLSEHKVVGIIRLDHPEPSRYAADDLRLLTIFADISAVALANTLLLEKTRQLAIHDGLTNLYVQRYFKDRLVEELARGFTLNQPCSVIVLDIDNFKEYNDTYGHIAGDIVLREIAALVKAVATPGAITARYGGEEFAMILPGCYQAAACECANMLCERIASKTIELRRQPTRVTVSVGVAAFPEQGISAEDLFKSADAAMYKAKQSGKNRVCTM